MSLTVYLIDESEGTEGEEFFNRNITHNLGKMAKEAGLYYALWRPEEINIFYAGDLIPILHDGLLKLKSDQTRYELLNPPNGWGSYDGLVAYVTDYLNACIERPTLKIDVCR